MARYRYLLQRDGSFWMAAAPGHLDLSDGPVGRGASAEEAIEALMQQPEFQLWLREKNLPNPTRADFVLETRGGISLDFIDAQGRRHIVNPSTDGTHGARNGIG